MIRHVYFDDLGPSTQDGPCTHGRREVEAVRQGSRAGRHVRRTTRMPLAVSRRVDDDRRLSVEAKRTFPRRRSQGILVLSFKRQPRAMSASCVFRALINCEKESGLARAIRIEKPEKICIRLGPCLFDGGPVPAVFREDDELDVIAVSRCELDRPIR